MSTADPLLQLELMIAAENKGTWQTNANNVFTQIAEAIAKTTTVTMASADYTLTDTTKSSTEAKAMCLAIGGTIAAGSANVIIPNRSKLYLLKVTCTLGGHTLGIKTSAGTAQTIVNSSAGGVWYWCYCDGANGVTLIPFESSNFAIASGTNTYTATLPYVPSTMYAGWRALVQFTNGNTAASPTLQLNGGTTYTLKKSGGTDLTIGDISTTMMALIVYDGTNLQVIAAKIVGSLALTDGGLKTTSFNAAVNTKYVAEGSGITVTGPASATTNDELKISVGATAVTFNPNGLKGNGQTGNITLLPFNTYLMTYNSTSGWV